MTDPLNVLRTPDGPVDPDPAFAVRLRARLERALDLPRGVAVSTATVQSNLAADVQADADAPAAATLGAAIPYLAVSDGRAAIDWYVVVFGAVLEGDPIVMPDGRIGHAELSLAGGKLYLADEFPDIGVVAPEPGAAAVSLVLAVTDVDARVAAALDSGGRLLREIAEAYGSRNATINDPFGHRWMLQQAMNTVPATEAPPAPWHQGDIGYVSIWTPDIDRAADFYRNLLGWNLAHHEQRAHQVVGQSMAMGLFEGRAARTSSVRTRWVTSTPRRRGCARLAAVPPARRRRSFGRVSDCVDPEGTHFAIYTPASEPGPRPPINGTSPRRPVLRDVQHRNSAGARDFYGAVLGWDVHAGSASRTDGR